MKVENPFTTFVGDFNDHSQCWWPDGDTTLEGKEIDDLLASRGLFPVISDPTF